MSDASTMAAFVARRASERGRALEARRQRLTSALPALAAFLAERGARRVWLFGSLAWGGVHERSDIDLAVEGLPSSELLRVQGELLRLAPCSTDLVRIEEAPPRLAERIHAGGRLLHG